ncbi:MAG TPA: STN domain-containing protein, partial [Novosphingobium sp.]
MAAPGRAVAAPAPATIAIDDGPLSAALARIAAAEQLEIVSLEPRLASRTVRGQTLPADPMRALTRLLTGTGLRAVRTGPRSFRIERSRRSPAPPDLSPLPGPQPGEPEPVTVVASKFPTSLRDYPGTVMRLPGADGTGLPVPTRLDDLARRLPVVTATAFGDGRDKLFVRGIADSSFNGASQPATAIYFDDAPIGFGSPNA